MAMASKVQYEVGLQFSTLGVAGDLIRSLLVACGFDLSNMVEQNYKKVTRYSFYIKGKKSAERMLGRMRALKLRGTRVFIKKHFKADWSSRWKKDWRPFALTKRFHVIPLWQSKRGIPEGKESVFLETTNAFGTGLHETTRLMAEMIQSMEGKFESFLDVGTGTGILTIVALKCGFHQVEAFDIDPSAVKVARDNLKANRLAGRVFVADIANYKPQHTFDLVAANLVSPDLIEFGERIVSWVRPGGVLVVSGISIKNIQRVKKAFVSPVVKLGKVVRGREWSAISFSVQCAR